MAVKLETKEKVASAGSVVSSVVSFLGGYQVCHSICIGIIALLSLIGITITTFPLIFLTKVAVPFWIAAVALLAISLVFYFKKKCISRNLIILNAGVIMAGVPFENLQSFRVFFWVIGGGLVLLSIILFIKSNRR
ncbi:MAG TPA: hypothetical protein VJC07_03985 [Candidatus Nanoarchaeia archaeon]|nr:hypothetical protein [Candidatus Nanoarchaeia archaeon]